MQNITKSMLGDSIKFPVGIMARGFLTMRPKDVFPRREEELATDLSG